jgi:serine/threonine-protein kinase
MTDPGSSERPTALGDREPVSGAVARPGHPTEVAGRYRILGRIGDGGMGVVYKAEHVLSKKKLAVKLLHPHLSHGKQAVERFKREVSAAAEIDHPGIVQVFDAGMDTDGSFYMAMELLEGHSLASEMKKSWPGTKRALEIVLELCEPLARAHKKGFIHRDLKPDNVFVARDPETGAERVKLLDFGLAREITKKGTTESGVTFGTPEYMAPEQSMSAKDASTQADVWSIGVMLYELLSGFHPFTGETPNAIMVSAIKDAHTPLIERAPHVPKAICDAVELALIKNVHERLQTAGALLDALHEAIDASAPLDDRKPAQTHRMLEMLEAGSDEDAPDLSGIPAADDDAIARSKRLGQRHIATEAHRSIPGDTSSGRWKIAIAAGVISLVAVAVLALWSWMSRTTPEIDATPLATDVPVASAVPPPPSSVVPDVVSEAEPPVTELVPPPSTEVAVAPPASEAPRPRASSPALTTLSAEDAARARECLAHNDFACALTIYRTSRDPHDLTRLIDTLEHVGRHREALGAMRDFVRRFPRNAQSDAYRPQLAAAGM